MPKATNIVILTGRLVVDPQYHDDGRWPKVVITIQTKNGKFYAEGVGEHLTDGTQNMMAGHSVVVIGQLFRRHNLVGVRIKQVLELNGCLSVAVDDVPLLLPD